MVYFFPLVMFFLRKVVGLSFHLIKICALFFKLFLLFFGLIALFSEKEIDVKLSFFSKSIPLLLILKLFGFSNKKFFSIFFYYSFSRFVKRTSMFNFRQLLIRLSFIIDSKDNVFLCFLILDKVLLLLLYFLFILNIFLLERIF